ncbi:MAG: toll/interleukin-1 receptor domain-containing protein, partial [Acidimicrobiia bacterium]
MPKQNPPLEKRHNPKKKAAVLKTPPAVAPHDTHGEFGQARDDESAPLLFLSYDTDDQAEARELRHMLQEDGYQVWMAPEDIRGTRPWTQQIVDAISAASMLVVLVSAESTNSEHVGREVKIALDKVKPILPVRIEEVAVSGTLEYHLSLVQWVDAFPPPLNLHRSVLKQRIGDLLTDRSEAIVASDPRPKPLSSPTASPYQGLAAFQPEDAARFYGRDELVATLLRRLENDRVLVVGGPSGSGKSSVVRAGLVPAIGAGAISGSARWPVALFTPRSNPVAELSYQLMKLSRDTTQPSGEPLRETFVTRDTGEARYLAEKVTAASGGLLLVIDQFEELFTLNGRNEQEAFVELLAELADPVDSRVRVVI